MKHTAVLLFLVTPVLVLAGTGAAFLKIPVGPRVCATGEAAVAYIDDASALFYNPAGLANVPTYNAVLAHNQWLLDMNHEYVAGVYGTEGLGKFGVAFDYWGSGAIQGINIRGTFLQPRSTSSKHFPQILPVDRLNLIHPNPSSPDCLHLSFFSP